MPWPTHGGLKSKKPTYLRVPFLPEPPLQRSMTRPMVHCSFWANQDRVRRPACLKEINTYIDKHGLDPLVVCSRSEEYFSQSARISLHNAVTIQPLTSQQIDEYLISAGEQLAALRTVLHHDTVLLNMATTPLM